MLLSNIKISQPCLRQTALHASFVKKAARLRARAFARVILGSFASQSTIYRSSVKMSAQYPPPVERAGPDRLWIHFDREETSGRYRVSWNWNSPNAGNYHCEGVQ
jgi:hypothetical protein